MASSWSDLAVGNGMSVWPLVVLGPLPGVRSRRTWLVAISIASLSTTLQHDAPILRAAFVARSLVTPPRTARDPGGTYRRLGVGASRSVVPTGWLMLLRLMPIYALGILLPRRLPHLRLRAPLVAHTPALPPSARHRRTDGCRWFLLWILILLCSSSKNPTALLPLVIPLDDRRCALASSLVTSIFRRARMTFPVTP